MARHRIRFRINKVSRRKDGQSFKINLRLPSQKGLDASEVEPVYTSTIEVLSKRKSSSNATKKRKLTLKAYEDMEHRSRATTLQAITRLHDKIDRLTMIIQKQGFFKDFD